MTETDRMLSGKLYLASDPDLVCARSRARQLTGRYNAGGDCGGEYRRTLLARLLGRVGADCYIEAPFRCDYGFNIAVGDGFYANYDCIFLDVAKITIGSRVLLGPRVCLFTAGHPVDASIRAEGLEFGKPITIGDEVWIGGNSVVNPGVTIGPGSVIGSGSVVTRDIPAGVIAAGNPCRVLREITDEDQAHWERMKRDERL